MAVHLSAICYLISWAFYKVGCVFEVVGDFFEYLKVTVSWEFAVIIAGLIFFRFRGILAIIFTFLVIYRLEVYGNNHFGVTLRELGSPISGDDLADFFYFIWGNLNLTDWTHEAQDYGDPSLLKGVR